MTFCLFIRVHTYKAQPNARENGEREWERERQMEMEREAWMRATSYNSRQGFGLIRRLCLVSSVNSTMFVHLFVPLRNLPVPSSSFLSSSIVVAVSLLHCKLVWTWKIENLCWFSVAFRLAPSQRKIYIFHRNGLISIYQQFSQIPVNLFIHLLLLLTVICTEYIRSHSHPTLPLRPLLVSYNCLLGYNLDDADEWRVERLAHILYGSPFELNARKHFGIIIKSTIFVMV